MARRVVYLAQQPVITDADGTKHFFIAIAKGLQDTDGSVTRAKGGVFVRVDTDATHNAEEVRRNLMDARSAAEGFIRLIDAELAVKPVAKVKRTKAEAVTT